MSALSELGRVGLTAVGDSPEQADAIYRRAERILTDEAARALTSPRSRPSEPRASAYCVPIVEACGRIRSSSICTTCQAPAQAARSLGLDAQVPIVALLPRESPSGTPGASAHHAYRLPAHPAAPARRTRILPVAQTLAMDEVQQFLTHYPMPLTVISGQSHTALCAAHFALVASGTATLEAGLIGTPMVVVYKLHPITAWLARRVLCIPYIGLVNIVAGRPVVPELLQEALCPQTLAALALHCLEHPEVAQYVRQISHPPPDTGHGGRCTTCRVVCRTVFAGSRDARCTQRCKGNVPQQRGLVSSLATACLVRLLVWGLRLLYSTLRSEHVQQYFEQRAWHGGTPVLLAFWHGRMLVFSASLPSSAVYDPGEP